MQAAVGSALALRSEGSGGVCSPDRGMIGVPKAAYAACGDQSRGQTLPYSELHMYGQQTSNADALHYGWRSQE